MQIALFGSGVLRDGLHAGTIVAQRIDESGIIGTDRKRSQRMGNAGKYHRHPNRIAYIKRVAETDSIFCAVCRRAVRFCYIDNRRCLVVAPETGGQGESR